MLRYADTYSMVVPDVMPVSWWLLALSAASLVLIVESTMLVAVMRRPA